MVVEKKPTDSKQSADKSDPKTSKEASKDAKEGAKAKDAKVVVEDEDLVRKNLFYSKNKHSL